MDSWEEFKTAAKAFVPGWTLYSKYRKGTDYTEVGTHKYYPEIFETGRAAVTIIPVAIGAPFAAAYGYFIYSMLAGAPELKLARRIEFRKMLPELAREAWKTFKETYKSGRLPNSTLQL